MTRAFIFPGQGSQYVGMAKDLYENSEPARQMLEKLAEAVGFDLLGVMFEGPDDQLRQTQNAQPALFAHSMAVLAALEGALGRPAMVAGHSLGEYSALAAAGAIDAADGIRLVRVRGELMAKAGEIAAGAMAAVIGMDEDKLSELVDACSAGTVVIANYNCPGQLVISGEREAVAMVGRAATESGARAVIPLKVSGAFHSPLMASIAEEFAQHLSAAPLRDAAVPVYCNVDASPHTAAAELRGLLQRQLTAPVLWEASVKRMIAAGASEFYEIGPKDVLTKMMGRIDPSVKAYAVGTWEDVVQLRR
ncbi:MAG: ACP S-malonyltransferase [Armatimonadetes bacterium]|nr:ACP S-malonyltransferase [Armatimonadota bacterium]